MSVRAFDAQGFPRGPARLANRQQMGDQSLGFVLPVSTNRLWVGWTTEQDDGSRAARFRVLERP